MWSQSFENDCRLVFGCPGLILFSSRGSIWLDSSAAPCVLNPLQGLGDFLVYSNMVFVKASSAGTIPFAVSFNVGHPYVLCPAFAISTFLICFLGGVILSQ